MRISKIAIVGTVLLPSLAKANWEMPASGTGGVENVPTEFDNTIIVIINYILGFVAMIAILAIIWGGIQYLTSAGNQDMVRSGKETIKNALVGLIVAGLAYAIVNVIVTTILV